MQNFKVFERGELLAEEVRKADGEGRDLG